MQENNVIDAEIIAETPVPAVETPAEKPISKEEAAHIALIEFNRNKLLFNSKLVTMNKKNVKKLLHVLLFYPLQDDKIHFSESLKEVYDVTQEILQNKVTIMNHLQKKAKEEKENGKASE